MSPPPNPPPAPPSPPKIHREFNIWNPGGHPEILQHAAGAWRALAGDLRAAGRDLGQQVHGVRAAWSGKASDAFQGWGDQLGASLDDSAAQCDTVARQLDELAAQIRSTNDQLHELYVALGVTAAIGIGFSIVTLGFSDVAAAGAATAEVEQASALVAFLETVLGGTFGKWAINFGISLVATGVEKMVHNRNHLDFWDGWGPADIAHALLGADMLVLAGPIAGRIPGFSAFQEAHPVLAAGATSGAAGATAAFASDLSGLAFEGRPLGLDTLLDVGLSGVVSGGASALGEWGAARFGATRSTVTEFSPSAGFRSSIEVPTPGRSFEVLRPAPSTVRLTPDGPGYDLATSPAGLLVATARTPKEFSLSPGGPTYDVQAGPRQLLVAGTRPPELGGLRAADWTVSSSGLQVPGPTLPHGSGLVIPADAGVSQRQVMAGNPWQQSPRNLRSGTFKLPVKSFVGATNGWTASAATAPPGTMPPSPVVTAPGAPPPPIPLPPPQVIGGGSYTVRPGDSLWRVAQRTYGDGELWRVLYRANPQLGANPGLIHSGQVLAIPSIAQPAP